jgi:hypothetical protein
MTFIIPKQVSENYKNWRKTASKQELEDWDKSGEDFLKELVKKNKNVHIISNEGIDVTDKWKK